MLSGNQTTWLEINLPALRNNIRQIQTITQRPVMVVIKANGYGHGMVEVARAAVDAGAAWLGVARLDEAVVLRRSGINLPVLVLGFCMPDQAAEALDYQISLTVYHPDLIAAYAARISTAGQRLRIHAKIDSGMGRLGVFPEQGLDFIRQIVNRRGLELEGVFTHLARADEPEAETTEWQLRRFQLLVEELEAKGLRPPLVHAANSAGALYFPGARYDLVRPGIAVYGLHPSPQTPLPPGFQPVMTWKARLASVKELPGQHGVSYGHRYTTTRQERIGVVPVGYADGFRRTVGNYVLVGGERVPIVGKVCMDQCMVQLDAVSAARIGDEVVLMGQQADQRISAEEIAAAWGTIGYEVVCGMAGRIPRYYIDLD